jgi:hypothetical protein
MNSRALGVACYALLLFGNAAAVLTNGTIDDQYGDSVTGALPTYFPPNLWVQGDQCSSSTCPAQPDPELAFDQSE